MCLKLTFCKVAAAAAVEGKKKEKTHTECFFFFGVCVFLSFLVRRKAWSEEDIKREFRSKAVHQASNLFFFFFLCACQYALPFSLEGDKGLGLFDCKRNTQ